MRREFLLSMCGRHAIAMERQTSTVMVQIGRMAGAEREVWSRGEPLSGLSVYTTSSQYILTNMLTSRKHNIHLIMRISAIRRIYQCKQRTDKIRTRTTYGAVAPPQVCPRWWFADLFIRHPSFPGQHMTCLLLSTAPTASSNRSQVQGIFLEIH